MTEATGQTPGRLRCSPVLVYLAKLFTHFTQGGLPRLRWEWERRREQQTPGHAANERGGTVRTPDGVLPGPEIGTSLWWDIKFSN